MRHTATVSTGVWTNILPLFAAILILMIGVHASAAPTGGNIVSGSAVLQDLEGGDIVGVQQSSNNAIIEWQSFDLGTSENFEFDQPGSDAITLNRVLGAGASMIDGEIEANGNVFIINTDGVVFGANAVLDVNSLLATTMDIDNADFMAGDFDFQFPGSPTAAIINRGSITAADAGLVAFVAPNVANEGIIGARLGTITLAAGEAFTLDFFGDGLVAFAAVEAAGGKSGGVDVTGAITAEGGAIYLTATAARDFIETVINVEADLVARSVETRGGKIILTGDDNSKVTVTDATLDASGLDGGEISIIGGEVIVAESAELLADGLEPEPIDMTWTFETSGFGGADTGSTLTGSFDYNVEANTFSNIMVISAAGATLPGATYIAVGPLASSNQIDFVSTADSDIAGAYRLNIGFDGAMTYAGGTLNIVFGSERFCLDSNCAFPGFGPNARGLIGSTSITASPVVIDEGAYEGEQNGGQISVMSTRRTEFAGLVSVKPGPEFGEGGDIVLSSDGFLIFTGEAFIGEPPREGTLTLVGDPPPDEEEMDDEVDEMPDEDVDSPEEMQKVDEAVSKNNSEIIATGETSSSSDDGTDNGSSGDTTSGDVLFDDGSIFDDGDGGGDAEEEERLLCLLGVSTAACSR